MGCRRLDWNDLSSVRPYYAQGAYGVRNEVMADGSQLYLMGARWYDPQLGRFLSPDPIGFQGGLNLYSYVGNRVPNFVDPSGLAADPTIKAGLQAAANLLGVSIDPSSIPVYSASGGLDPGAFGETGYVKTANGYQLAIVVSSSLSSHDAALVAGHELLHYLRALKRDKASKGVCPKNRPVLTGKQNLQEELDARKLEVQLSKLFPPMNPGLAQSIQRDAQAFSNPSVMQDALLPTLILSGYETPGPTKVRNVTGLTSL